MNSLMLAALALSSQTVPDYSVLAIESRNDDPQPYPVTLLTTSDLNGNAVADFVHQSPNNVHGAVDPSFVDAPVFASVGSTAAASLPGDGGIYVSNGAGLRYAEHSNMPWTWTTSAVIDGGDWVNAASLEFFDVDGVGGMDLLGVSGDRYGILLATNGGSGFLGSAQALATTTGRIDDVIAYRYHASRAAMIVASTSIGLECFWITGGSVTTIPRSSPNGRLAVLREDGQVDRFAWLRNQGGNRRLEVHSYPGTVDTALVLPTWLESMASGNYNNDALADLIFGGAPLEDGEYPVRVRILRQTTSGTFTLQGDDARDYTFADSGGDAEYEPFMGDADGDGDGDLVVAAPDGALYLAFSDEVDLDETSPYILETDPAGGPSIMEEHAWMPRPLAGGPLHEDDYRFRVRLDASQTPPTIDYEGAPVTATHIEWMIWDSQLESSNGSNGAAEFSTQPIPLAQGHFDLSDPSQKVNNHPSLMGQPFYLVPCTVFDAATAATDIRYLTLRYVAYDSTNTVALVRWPARQHYIVENTNIDAVNYLQSLTFTSNHTNGLSPVDPVAYGAPQGGGDSNPPGGGGTLGANDCCPDFGNDCPPPPPPAPGN